MAEFPWFESRRAHHLRSSRSKHSHQSRISAESRAVFQIPGSYSTCSNGAPAESPSNDSAVRAPVPETMIASELPLTQPRRFTIS